MNELQDSHQHQSNKLETLCRVAVHGQRLCGIDGGTHLGGSGIILALPFFQNHGQDPPPRYCLTAARQRMDPLVMLAETHLSPSCFSVVSRFVCWKGRKGFVDAAILDHHQKFGVCFVN